MNYDWKNMDLKNACIFDLTDDIELIRDIVCDDSINLEDKELYLSESHSILIACEMHDFATRINDQDLVNALEEVFSKEYAKERSMFDE
ncbi:MAG: hypothetical protein H6Q25_1193 [Bacteroidetes bacterium]|nr:hypothetical protein [Bacteroidota bacterium]